MKKIYILRIISFSVSAAIMLIIFKFSSQDGTASSSLSLRVTKIFARIFFSGYNSFPEQTQLLFANELHGFIRKLAHFSIYAALGASLFISVGLAVKRLARHIPITVLICAVYAVSDEIHQLFVSKRAGSIADVFIDVSGSVCGIIAALSVYSVIFLIKSKRSNLITPNKP